MARCTDVSLTAVLEFPQLSAAAMRAFITEDPLFLYQHTIFVKETKRRSAWMLSCSHINVSTNSCCKLLLVFNLLTRILVAISLPTQQGKLTRVLLILLLKHELSLATAQDDVGEMTSCSQKGILFYRSLVSCVTSFSVIFISLWTPLFSPQFFPSPLPSFNYPYSKWYPLSEKVKVQVANLSAPVRILVNHS